MIFMLPQQFVKQETPGWQRNFRLLSAVSLAGMILLGLLSDPNKDLLKEVFWGACFELLMVATFREYVIGGERTASGGHKLKLILKLKTERFPVCYML